MGPLLALLVDVYLEEGCFEEAEQTARRLPELRRLSAAHTCRRLRH